MSGNLLNAPRNYVFSLPIEQISLSYSGWYSYRNKIRENILLIMTPFFKMQISLICQTIWSVWQTKNKKKNQI